MIRTACVTALDDNDDNDDDDDAKIYSIIT